MIKHIVMFKLNSFDTEKQKNEICQQIVDALNALPEKISEILEFEVGVDFLKKENSYDIVLISKFENKEALYTYSVHPAHLRVVELIKQNCSDRKAVDYNM